METDMLKIIKQRRSEYNLDKKIKSTVSEIKEVVSYAIKHTPSAFNVQSSRVILLLNKHHDKFWSIVKEELRKRVPPEKFAPTEEKINSFANAFGTILFFEDDKLTEGLQTQYPRYKDNFPKWAEQGNGMLQYCIWDLLTALGLGASLQHYNPIIDNEVKKEWTVPANFRLIAQMPFGNVYKKADKKDFAPIKERLFIYK